MCLNSAWSLFQKLKDNEEFVTVEKFVREYSLSTKEIKKLDIR